MIKRGTIALWFGAAVNVPYGWRICDGNGGTPDLRNNFIVGAGDTYAVDDSGGSVNHNHTFTGDGHSHGIGVGGDVETGVGKDNVTSSDPATGTTDNNDNLPPYHALWYIMKT